MTSDLPRMISRPHGSRLVTRDEAADMLGFSRKSMATVMLRNPDRWPKPAALLKGQRGKWKLLWDADELLAAAPTDVTYRRGGVASISDSDGLLTCLECGLRFRGLGKHLAAAHDMTGPEYRETYNLPATGSLNSDMVRQATSDRMCATLAADPHAVDHLLPWNRPEILAEMTKSAVKRNRETRDRPMVKQHRLPGQRYATQVMQGIRRDQLEAKVRAAGFASLAAAIEATRGLTSRAAAERIGIGATTVLRWRKRLG